MKAIFIRLVILLIAIPASHAESVFGDWSVTETVQEIDDSIVTLASLYEEERRAILYIRCWHDEVQVFVNSLVGEFHDQDVEVQVRIDNDPPEQYVWMRSASRGAIFVPKDETEPLLERLVDYENPNKEKRLLVKVPAGYTISFNLKGALWAILPIAFACEDIF